MAVLESDSGEDLDNDTYENSDDFSDESDDASVADGINTHSMSNDDDSSGSDSHRAGAPQTQGQAQHSPPRKRYANTQMVSDSNNATNNEVSDSDSSEVSIAPPKRQRTGAVRPGPRPRARGGQRQRQASKRPVHGRQKCDTDRQHME